MATSGTVSATEFNTLKVIDHALRRCRIPAERITPEILQVATDNLYLLLSSLQAKGLALWCQETMILPLTTGQVAIETPDGTWDILNCNLRNCTRLEGTYATSNGGDADLAFDDDYSTSCTQTSTNGNISIQFDDETSVTTFGILSNGTHTWTLTAEWSDDGSTWTTARALASQEYEDQVWSWFDLDPIVTCTYFRIRVSGGGTLDLRELYVGNNPTEIPVARISRDQYQNFSNKYFTGRPLQYWFDRQRDNPLLYVWPAIGAGYREYQFKVVRQRYIQDVGTLRDTLDIPQRWFEAVVCMLAWRVAIEWPEVDPKLWPNLKAMSDEQTLLINNEERDNSPIQWLPNILVYTQ